MAKKEIEKQKKRLPKPSQASADFIRQITRERMKLKTMMTEQQQ